MDRSFSLAVSASVHPILMSCLWAAALLLLGLGALQCFRRALGGDARLHPLVALLMGVVLMVGAAVLWASVRPDLRWGAVVVIAPAAALALSVLRPRFRRWSPRH